MASLLNNDFLGLGSPSLMQPLDNNLLDDIISTPSKFLSNDYFDDVFRFTPGSFLLPMEDPGLITRYSTGDFNPFDKNFKEATPSTTATTTIAPSESTNTVATIPATIAPSVEPLVTTIAPMLSAPAPTDFPLQLPTGRRIHTSNKYLPELTAGADDRRDSIMSTDSFMSSASTAYPAAAAYNKAYPAIPAHHQETVAPAAIAPPTVAPTEVATDNGTSKPKTGGKRKGGPSTEEPDEKRARFLEKNRQAASKCRQKKKAQIKELERRAEVEAERNRELQRMVAALRDELIVIKGQLLDHGECGCPVIQRWTASAQFSQHFANPARPAPVDPAQFAF